MSLFAFLFVNFVFVASGDFDIASNIAPPVCYILSLMKTFSIMVKCFLASGYDSKQTILLNIYLATQNQNTEIILLGVLRKRPIYSNRMLKYTNKAVE